LQTAPIGILPAPAIKGLNDMDRRVAADPAFLQELKVRALRYLASM
jgi:hypothetical protein